MHASPDQLRPQDDQSFDALLEADDVEAAMDALCVERYGATLRELRTGDPAIARQAEDYDIFLDVVGQGGRDHARTMFSSDEEYDEWADGLSPNERAFIRHQQRKYEEVNGLDGDFIDKLEQTASGLVHGKLPEELEKRLGDTYFLGIGSTPYARDCTEAEQAVQATGGIAPAADDVYLNGNGVIYFDSETPQDKTERLLGYRRGADAGSYILAIPSDNAGELAHADIDMRAGLMRMDGVLAPDLLAKTTDGRQAFSGKYVAGFIDRQRGFVPNHNFMLSEEPDLRVGPVVSPDIRQLAADPVNVSGAPEAERRAAYAEAQLLAGHDKINRSNRRVVEKGGRQYWATEYPTAFTFRGQMWDEPHNALTHNSIEEDPDDTSVIRKTLHASDVIIETETESGESEWILFKFNDTTGKVEMATSGMAAAQGSNLKMRELDTSTLEDVVMLPGSRMMLGRDADGRISGSRGVIKTITALDMKQPATGSKDVINDTPASDVRERFNTAIREARQKAVAGAAGGSAVRAAAS